MIGLGAGFFTFILMGVPVAFVFGLAALVAILLADLPLVVVAHRFFAGLNNFTLMAIPFFLLTGLLMEAGGLARRIIDFAMATGRMDHRQPADGCDHGGDRACRDVRDRAAPTPRPSHRRCYPK
jgi:hypothetical protein